MECVITPLFYVVIYFANKSPVVDISSAFVQLIVIAGALITPFIIIFIINTIVIAQDKRLMEEISTVEIQTNTSSIQEELSLKVIIAMIMLISVIVFTIFI